MILHFHGESGLRDGMVVIAIFCFVWSTFVLISRIDGFAFPTLSPATIPVRHNLPTSEYQALQTLYQSTGGDLYWRYHEIDLLLGQNPWNFTGLHNHVSCPKNCYFPFSTISCTVIELTLDRMNLTGTIPNQIGEFTSLVSLRLSFNQLNGTLPSTLTQLKDDGIQSTNWTLTRHHRQHTKLNIFRSWE
jgi:hypothetical protein